MRGAERGFRRERGGGGLREAGRGPRCRCVNEDEDVDVIP
jgi:hypothetical protein